MKDKLDISIVVPAYNEQDNVVQLYSEITKVISRLKKSYEIIFIDDGSTDNTFINLEKIHKKDKKLKIIKFRRNFGQTAALDAGFKASKGAIIISMDADLQNDPSDIPTLLSKMKGGYDVVSGWRKDRKDSIFKKFASRGANILRKIIFQDNIHDSGCTLKAYKKECFDDLDLYGEMHRFIPALLSWKGFKITEIPVKHHKRKFGKTKYGIKRTIKGFLDMIIVNFWMRYSTRPMHMFGSLGILSSSIGILIGLYLTFMKIFYSVSIGNRPLLLLSVLMVIVGIQFLVFGIVSDILIKIFYQKGGKPPYNVEKIYY